MEPTPAPAPNTAPSGCRGCGGLGAEGIELVYGGASVGIMGELADAAAPQVRRHVTGHISAAAHPEGGGAPWDPDLIVVASMHQRKSRSVDLSDGIIALPGGIGTLEGSSRFSTWGQLGIHAKPCGILNIAGYFDALTGISRPAVAEGFWPRRTAARSWWSRSGALLERMRAYAPSGDAPLMGRANR